MSNFDQLVAAGLLNAKTAFTAQDKALIETLTQEEVGSLISVKQKMGTFLKKYAAPDRLDAAEDMGVSPALGIVF